MFKSLQFMESNDRANSRWAYLESKAVSDAKSLVAELCRRFYTMGWVLGTGGSVSLRVHDDYIPRSRQFIVMSPSGVQKERMDSEDMYVLSADGLILSNPTPKPYPNKPPKCTDCASLFMKVYEICNAGAVIHSHGIESCLITMINSSSKEFRITNMEMIKGIGGHSYTDELVVPIIENTAYERELTEPLTEAIKTYPKATAVLVRNHGVYVWGDSWISAKTQAECYHYLFDAAIKLHQLGLEWSAPSRGHIDNPNGVWGCRALKFRRNLQAEPFGLHYMIEPSQRCVLLDIKGATTPINFVTDVLFPYALKKVGKHLAATYESEETQGDIDFMRSQIWNDLKQGIIGPVPIPPDYVRKELVIDIMVAAVEFMLKNHRKVPALNQLLGHIWKAGFQNNDFVGVVFKDAREALERWHTSGIKVYVYSSYSRQVQQLLFANSNNGDLRKYFSGFFDTKLSDKKQSFSEIFQTVGVDKPADILFVTSVFQDAVAARAAGLEAVISVRLGNLPLPENHGFRTVKSFLQI